MAGGQQHLDAHQEVRQRSCTDQAFGYQFELALESITIWRAGQAISTSSTSPTRKAVLPATHASLMQDASLAVSVTIEGMHKTQEQARTSWRGTLR